MVASTVNLKHLRVNDHEGDVQSPAKSHGPALPIAPRESQSSGFRSGPGTILPVHSRLYRQTPPRCPPLVQHKEDRLRSWTATDNTRKTCAPVQRQLTLTDAGNTGPLPVTTVDPGVRIHTGLILDKNRI